MRYARVSSVVAMAAAIGLSLAPQGGAEGQAASRCSWEIEYDLAASLKLTDTPMGAGNGVYRIGPGKVVLRFDDRDGKPGGDVKMLRYEMRELFTIKSKVLAWSTTAVTDSSTSVAPDACGVVAEGSFDGGTLRWRTPVHGYRTEGTITCTGDLCGKFGAPAPGRSALRIPSHPVMFHPFVFAPDMKTFTMSTTHVAKTDSPKQSAEVALAGREARRACVAVPPCVR